MGRETKKERNQEDKIVSLFKNDKNRKTDEGESPLDKTIQFHSLQHRVQDNKSKKDIDHHDTYYPLYFKYPKVNRVDIAASDEDFQEYVKDSFRNKFPGRDISNKLNSKTSIYDMPRREIRVCSERDKLEKFFDKPFIICFGYIPKVSNQDYIYIRLLSKAIPIYSKSSNRENNRNILYNIIISSKEDVNIENEEKAMLCLINILNDKPLTIQDRKYIGTDNQVVSKNITATLKQEMEKQLKNSPQIIEIKVVLTLKNKEKEEKRDFLLKLEILEKFENLLNLEQVAYFKPKDKYRESFSYYQVGKLISLNYIFYEPSLTDKSRFFEVQSESVVKSNYQENQTHMVYTSNNMKIDKIHDTIDTHYQYEPRTPINEDVSILITKDVNHSVTLYTKPLTNKMVPIQKNKIKVFPNIEDGNYYINNNVGFGALLQNSFSSKSILGTLDKIPYSINFSGIVLETPKKYKGTYKTDKYVFGTDVFFKNFYNVRIREITLQDIRKKSNTIKEFDEKNLYEFFIEQVKKHNITDRKTKLEIINFSNMLIKNQVEGKEDKEMLTKKKNTLIEGIKRTISVVINSDDSIKDANNTGNIPSILNVTFQTSKDLVHVDYKGTIDINDKIANEKNTMSLTNENIVEFPIKSKLEMKVFDSKDSDNSLLDRINTENYLDKGYEISKQLVINEASIKNDKFFKVNLVESILAELNIKKVSVIIIQNPNDSFTLEMLKEIIPYFVENETNKIMDDMIESNYKKNGNELDAFKDKGKFHELRKEILNSKDDDNGIEIELPFMQLDLETGEEVPNYMRGNTQFLVDKILNKDNDNIDFCLTKNNIYITQDPEFNTHQLAYLIYPHDKTNIDSKEDSKPTSKCEHSFLKRERIPEKKDLSTDEIFNEQNLSSKNVGDFIKDIAFKYRIEEYIVNRPVNLYRLIKNGIKKVESTNNLTKNAYLQQLEEISNYGYTSISDSNNKGSVIKKKEKNSDSVQDLIKSEETHRKLITGGHGLIKTQVGGRKVNGRYTNSPFYSSGFETGNNRKFYKMISPYSRSKHNFGFLNTLTNVKPKSRKHRIPYPMKNIHGFTQSLSHSGVINAVVHEKIHPGNVPFTLQQTWIFSDLYSTMYWETFRKQKNVSNTAKGGSYRFLQLIMSIFNSVIPRVYLHDQSKDLDNYTINYKKMEDQIKHENPSFSTESKPEYFINEDRLSQITMQVILGNTRESKVLQKH